MIISSLATIALVTRLCDQVSYQQGFYDDNSRPKAGGKHAS